MTPSPTPNTQGRNSRPIEAKTNSPGSPRRVDVAQGREDPETGPSVRTRHQCPQQPSPARPLTRGSKPAASYDPAAAESVRTAHKEALRPAKRGLARPTAAWKGLFPSTPPAPAWSAPPRPSWSSLVPAPPGPGPGRSAGLAAAAAECYWAAAGRPIRPKPPLWLPTVAHGRLRTQPLPAPPPCLLVGQTGSKRPRGRGDFYGAAEGSPQRPQWAVGGGASRVAGTVRGIEAAGKCSPARPQGRWEKRCGLSCTAGFSGPRAQHFGEISRGLRPVSVCALSHFSRLFGEDAGSWPRNDPGLRVRSQALESASCLLLSTRDSLRTSTKSSHSAPAPVSSSGHSIYRSWEPDQSVVPGAFSAPDQTMSRGKGGCLGYSSEQKGLGPFITRCRLQGKTADPYTKKRNLKLDKVCNWIGCCEIK